MNTCAKLAVIASLIALAGAAVGAEPRPKVWLSADVAHNVSVNVRTWSATSPPDSLTVFVRNDTYPERKTPTYGWMFEDGYGGTQLRDTEHDSVGISVTSSLGYYPAISWPTQVMVRAGAGDLEVLGAEDNLGLPALVTPALVSATTPTWSHSATGTLNLAFTAVANSPTYLTWQLWKVGDPFATMQGSGIGPATTHVVSVAIPVFAPDGDYDVRVRLQDGYYNWSGSITDPETIGTISITAAEDQTFTVVSSSHSVYCPESGSFTQLVTTNVAGRDQMRWRLSGSTPWTTGDLGGFNQTVMHWHMFGLFAGEEDDCSLISGTLWNVQFRLGNLDDSFTDWVSLPDVDVPE